MADPVDAQLSHTREDEIAADHQEDRLKHLTDVLLEHWERPRRMADERATELEEQLNKTKADLEKARIDKIDAKERKREWKGKARDLETRLAEMMGRAAAAEAKVEVEAARSAVAEQTNEGLQQKLEEAEQRLAGAGRLQRRRRPEDRRPFERRYNTPKHRRRYVGSGV